MTLQQYEIKLFMYKLWLATNPPLSKIIIENDKLAEQLNKIGNGRRINSKHRAATDTNKQDRRTAPGG